MPKRSSTTVNTDQAQKKAHWSLGLLAAVKDPKLFVKSDDLVNVIKDGYPKAEYHYLILPKESLSSLKSVTSKHLNLLKHMHKIALELSEENKGRNFKIGYHAQASMSQLHLHVISDDMNSDCLKTKKHWNSFTTNFFLNSEDIIENLEKNGKIDLLPSPEVCKKHMDTPLKCHKCDYTPKNMPDLKKHLKSVHTS